MEAKKEFSEAEESISGYKDWSMKIKKCSRIAASMENLEGIPEHEILPNEQIY